MYLLDTDHISLIDRGTAEGRRILSRMSDFQPSGIVVSVVSYEEQVRGLLSQLARPGAFNQQIAWYSRLEHLLGFYSATPLLSFDEAVVAQFQSLWMQRIRIGTMDLKIAATALAHNATLLTRNTQDFARVPELKVEDWSLGT